MLCSLPLGELALYCRQWCWALGCHGKRALSGSPDLVALLKVILHVVALVPMTLMSRLFKKCKCLLALITDSHTLNEHDLCYIEGR